MSAKSHHFNPVVYLREFASNKKKELWEYDLTTGAVKKSTPQDCGCKDYYHSFIRKDGTRDDGSLEKAFRSIENRLPKLFEAVRNKQSISVQIKANLIIFAALLRSRNPKTLHVLQNLNPTVNRDQVLLSALSALCGGDLQQLFGRMEWVFLCAPASKYFFTSDDPVCCWPSDECDPLGAIGPADKHVEITFPLTRRICAFAHWKSSFTQSYIILSSVEVDAVNHRTIENGCRFIYAPTNDSDILSGVKEMAHYRWT